MIPIPEILSMSTEKTSDSGTLPINSENSENRENSENEESEGSNNEKRKNEKSDKIHDSSSSPRCQKMTKKLVTNIRKKLKGMKIPAHRTQCVENLLRMFEQKPDIDFPVMWYHGENPIIELTDSLLHYIAVWEH